jgi:hypothetical protein
MVEKNLRLRIHTLNSVDEKLVIALDLIIIICQWEKKEKDAGNRHNH